jgi:LacI family transcriptional regulator
MLIPDPGNQFFGEFARAAEGEARAAGYCVVGLIVVVAARASWADRLSSDLALVALDSYPAGWRYDAVVVDNRLGMELAVAHLTELGQLRIGFLGGDPQLATGRERANGFRAALARRDLRPMAQLRPVQSRERTPTGGTDAADRSA